MSSHINPERLKNKYESSITLCYVMAALFLVIILAFSLHIQPLIYNVLSCNAGTTLFCEMDPLVRISDSSADVPHVDYSTILNINNNQVDQIISFPYYVSDGQAVSNFYVKLSFIATGSISTTGNVVTAANSNGDNLFNIGSQSGTDSTTNVVVVECALDLVTPEYISYVLQYLLVNNSTIKSYVFIERYQNSGTQFIYGIKSEGSGTPTITVSEVSGGTTITNDNSILGFTSLNLNKDSFQTHNPTIENANNGFLDLKLQQAAIARNPSVAGCAEPNAVFARNSAIYKFNPAHGLYYPTQHAEPDSATPCVHNSSTNPANCGYRFVDRTDRSTGTANGYQTNKMFYHSKHDNTGANNASSYYNGYTNGANSTKLVETYGKGSATESEQYSVLGFVHLQDSLFCAGFDDGSGEKPWLRNNFDNSTTAVGSLTNTPGDTNIDSSAYQYSTHPRLNGNTSSDSNPSLPIKLGFN